MGLSWRFGCRLAGCSHNICAYTFKFPLITKVFFLFHISSAFYRWNLSMIYFCTKVQKRLLDKSIPSDRIWPLTSAVFTNCVVVCIPPDLGQPIVIWKRRCIPILTFLGTCKCCIALHCPIMPFLMSSASFY